MAGCHPNATTVCIGASDDGRTIPAKVGDSVVVELYASQKKYTVARPVSGVGVLQLEGSGRLGAASLARYRAKRRGSAQLRASSRPVCRKHLACPQYVVEWRVTVAVS